MLTRTVTNLAPSLSTAQHNEESRRRKQESEEAGKCAVRAETGANRENSDKAIVSSHDGD